MKKFPCIESTIDITTVDGRTIRLWINNPDGLTRNVNDIAEKVQATLEDMAFFDNSSHLLEIFAELPNVNAVQIIEPHTHTFGPRYGTVVYTVPFEDVHG